MVAGEVVAPVGLALRHPMTDEMDVSIGHHGWVRILHIHSAHTYTIDTVH